MSLKIAVVGTGNVARKNYLPFLSKQQDVSLAYFSRTKAKAEECARRFGGHVAGSLTELLSDEPDSVLVLTRETQRFEAASAVLKAGKPKRLFFEKPLVAGNGQASVREDDFYKARELLQRAGAVGTETAMIFNYRFFDQTELTRKITAERSFGKLIFASLVVNYACWSHCIDLLHLFGGEIAEISAFAGEAQPEDGEPQPVDVTAAFKMTGGAAGTILGTNRMHFDLSLYEMMLGFERGVIRFSDLDVALQVFQNGNRYSESHALTGNYSRWDQYSASFEKSLSAYLESIRRGEHPPVPGLAGLGELQFEAGLRRSITERRPVNVQKEFPLEE